jgi:hypothetical protein
MKAITRAVDEALDGWYAKGYNDGLEAAACRTDNRTLCKCVSEDIKERIEHYERKDRENQAEPEGYDAGFLNGKEMVLQRAQEVIDKIIRATGDGGLSMDELAEIFGVGDSHSIFINYTLRDIIKRFDEYDEIHVGDEVVFDDGEKAVVTKVYNELQRVTAVCSDGGARCRKMDDFKKTGNHFAEVSKLIEKLGGKTE